MFCTSGVGYYYFCTYSKLKGITIVREFKLMVYTLLLTKTILERWLERILSKEGIPSHALTDCKVVETLCYVLGTYPLAYWNI